MSWRPPVSETPSAGDVRASMREIDIRLYESRDFFQIHRKEPSYCRGENGGGARKCAGSINEEAIMAKKGQAILDGLLLAVIPLVAFTYYFDTLRYWFFYDDAFNIFYSMEGLREIFLSHNYSNAFYTPLLPFSFKADVFFFKMNPLPYHVHNVLILVLIAFMVYCIIRLYSDRISAFLPAMIIILSTPSLVCVSWITLRQYLYAMLFALIAIYLHLRKERLTTVSRWHIIAILICCELSFMGKEQFVTLPVVLFLISKGGLRERISSTYLYFVLLLLHVVLRWYVLGGIGGYLGATYDPKDYAKTIFASFLTASAVLFGSKWIGFVIMTPLFCKPKKIMLVLMIWFASLAVSFLVMSASPSSDDFRYWFIAVILFAFLLGFSSNLLKRNFAKIAYLVVIFLVFSVHSWTANKGVKVFFNKETGIAKTISEALLGRRYQNALFLIPDNRYIVNPHYIYSVARDYLELYKLETLTSFYPFELLAYYPQIIGDFKEVYEIKDGQISDISSTVKNRIDLFRVGLLNDKLEIGLRRQGNAININLICKEGRQLSVFFLKKLGSRYFAHSSFLPYFSQHIELNRFLKSEDMGYVEILPIDYLSYKTRKWSLRGEPLDANGLYLTANCTNAISKTTALSNVLYIQKPGALF